MPTVKVANYSTAAALDIKDQYTAVDSADLSETAHEKRAAIVSELAKTYKPELVKIQAERSIRAKLVSMKCYVARKKVSEVTNKTAEKKDVMAVNLAAAFGSVEMEGKTRTLSAASLEKMNKPEIDILTFYFNQKILEAVEVNDEIDNATQDEILEPIADENDSQLDSD